MPRQTRYYSKKLIASDTQQIFALPRLAFIRVLNYGGEDIYLEFENDIDSDSIILPVRGDVEIPTDMLDMRYRVVSGTASSIYIYGLRHEAA